MAVGGWCWLIAVYVYVCFIGEKSAVYDMLSSLIHALNGLTCTIDDDRHSEEE